SEPDLLLLDEPCAGLDAQGREIFYDYLNDLRLNLKTGILMVTHDEQQDLILKPDKVIKLC
ncbi:MAG: ABC transporter ATP-binding protein, partial [Synergistaceae bacterium]|nr:ABC transporter ATP-binding protein [Synergistaceae bacterium]